MSTIIAIHHNDLVERGTSAAELKAFCERLQAKVPAAVFVVRTVYPDIFRKEFAAVTQVTALQPMTVCDRKLVSVKDNADEDDFTANFRAQHANSRIIAVSPAGSPESDTLLLSLMTL